MKVYPGIEFCMPENSKDTSSSQETHLWQAFAKGEETAFANLYEYFIPYLLNYGFRFTPDTPLIKDVAHDIFIELWDRRPKLGSVTNPKLYLLVSFRRKLLRKLSKAQKFLAASENPGFVLETIPSAEFQIISEEQRERELVELSNCLQKLSPREREVLYLRIYQEMSHQEIAKLLSITEKVSRNYFHLAIKKLRAWYPDKISLIGLLSLLVHIFLE